ncbi:MAG: hypothetical protein ACRYFX_03640 [Janthinobacterium lividum]
MTFNPLTYPVDDLTLPWGKTLTEIASLLQPRALRKPYGGWPNLRVACQSVYGLAAVECNIRAPAWHKPVLQVSYELAAPPEEKLLSALPWLAPLNALLGPTTEGKTYPEAQGRAGSVTYAANWQQPPVKVSLSVFGGVRPQEGGPVGAGLWLDWQDEVRVARPFYEAARAQTAALEAVASQAAAPLRFQTQDSQKAYAMLHFGTTPLPPGPAATLLRQSQRALYRTGLCETPTPLQRLLSDYEVALWLVPGGSQWAVSTRHDTVVLEPATSVQLTTLRPAKGAGGMLLDVGDLSLRDDYASPALGGLALAIEQRAGCPVSRTEDYDC